jgi:sRNA-binding protein
VLGKACGYCKATELSTAEKQKKQSKVNPSKKKPAKTQQKPNITRKKEKKKKPKIQENHRKRNTEQILLQRNKNKGKSRHLPTATVISVVVGWSVCGFYTLVILTVVEEPTKRWSLEVGWALGGAGPA